MKKSGALSLVFFYVLLIQNDRYSKCMLFLYRGKIRLLSLFVEDAEVLNVDRTSFNNVN